MFQPVRFVWGMAILIAATHAHAETPVERGEYLVNTIAACGNCHTPYGPDGKPRTDQALAGMPEWYLAEPFDLNVPNITPDETTGIGHWTDEEIITAIREGVRPDGRVLGPPMPFLLYRDISDRDVRAIVAYLRSIPAIENPVPRSVYRMPLPPAWGPPVTSVPDIDPNDTVAYGAYLAGPVGHCVDCHSPMTEHGPDIENQRGHGGHAFDGPWGTSVSSDLTPTSLSRWSDEDVKSMIRTGVRPDGSRMLPPMPFAYYSGISDHDLDAIVAYLRQLPPRN